MPKRIKRPEPGQHNSNFLMEISIDKYPCRKQILTKKFEIRESSVQIQTLHISADRQAIKSDVKVSVTKVVLIQKRLTNSKNKQKRVEES